MQVYVINLARRPDRRAFMLEQANALGLTLHFVDAVDAREFHSSPIDVKVEAGMTRNRIADGDLACTLSHRKIWQMIVASGERYAAILEDDILLSRDAPLFLGSDQWIPEQAQLIKLERYSHRGKLHAVDQSGHSIHSRSLRRFHTKHAGSAGYIVSNEAARLLLEDTATVREPVDQVMFNPSRSTVFSRLKPYMLDPAICEQLPETLKSDIRVTRAREKSKLLSSISRELRGACRRLVVLAPVAAAILYRQVQLRAVEFR